MHKPVTSTGCCVRVTNRVCVAEFVTGKQTATGRALCCRRKLKTVCAAGRLSLIRDTVRSGDNTRDAHLTLRGPVVVMSTVPPGLRADVFCVDLRTNSDYFPIQH